MKQQAENQGMEIGQGNDKKKVTKSRAKAANGVQKAKTKDGAKAKVKPAADKVKKDSPKAKKDSPKVKKDPAKVKKARAHPSVKDMVQNAFNVLKNRKGISLAAIYKKVGEQCTMSKTTQTYVRKYIRKEFEAGEIKMINHDGAEVNFSKRFALKKN